jgi:hypothetical protein
MTDDVKNIQNQAESKVKEMTDNLSKGVLNLDSQIKDLFLQQKQKINTWISTKVENAVINAL